jgi:hypothetical protein
MGVFAFYFLICLLALIVRGYYRVPPACLIHEIIDKEERTVKSIIADRFECKCHYTNFLWYRASTDTDNQTMSNISMSNFDSKRRFEPMALVRNTNTKKNINCFSLISLLTFLMD